MTDPDERIINRAIAHLDHRGKAELQDLREDARAALHRLFRDRRRLEVERDRLRELLSKAPHSCEAFDHALYTEVERLRELLGYMLKQVDDVQRTSVIRESNIYREARAALTQEEE